MTLVDTLKKDRLDQARALAIPVLRDHTLLGQLVPIGPWILHEGALIARLASWRGQAMDMFLAQFDSTPEKTEAYLRRCSIGQANRILFMVESANAFIGHVGLANIDDTSAEVDNLMRGVSAGPAGLMAASEGALVAWAFTTLALDSLFLRGLSHNGKAKIVHEQLGFVTTEVLPLRREPAGDGTLLVPCAPNEANIDLTCDVMTLDRGRFQAQSPA